MRTNREITDMENFYATATFEEAIAYFKSKSTQCYAEIKNALVKAKVTIAGMMSRFAKASHGTAAALRRDLTIAKVLLNTEIETEQLTSKVLDDLEERFEMELLLIEAKEILLTKNNHNYGK